MEIVMFEELLTVGGALDLEPFCVAIFRESCIE